MNRCLLLMMSSIACVVACSDGSMDASNGALRASQDKSGEEQPPGQRPAAELGAARAVPGNPPSCAAVIPGTDLVTFKIDPVKSGTYTSPDGRLTVTIVASEKVFSFTSNAPVGAVIVKGGPGANVYEFAPGTSGEAALVAPRGAGLSHLNFCYPPPGGGGGTGGSGNGSGGRAGSDGSGQAGSAAGGASFAGSGNGGTPTAGSGGGAPCPPNLQLWLSTEGASICTPIPIEGECPSGYVLDLASEGRYCVPARAR